MKQQLCFDIGSHDIKILVYRKQKKALEFLQFHRLRIPTGAIQDGRIVEPLKFERTIREFLNSHGIKAKKVILSFLSSQIIIRPGDFPWVEPSQIQNLVELNGEEYLPFSIENHTLSYYILEETMKETDHKKLKLLLIAAPISLIKEYKDCMRSIDLEIECIGCSEISLVEFVKKQVISQNHMVFDLGYNHTTVLAVIKDKLSFVHTSFVGIESLIEAYNDFSIKEVENKRQIAAEIFYKILQPAPSIKFTQYFAEALHEFKEMIIRYIRYFESLSLGEDIKKIYITGEGAGIEKILEFFQTILEPSCMMLPMDPALYSKVPMGNIHSFTASMGSIYSNYNVMTDSIGKNIREKKMKYRAVVFVPLSLVLSIILFVLPYYHINRLESKKETLENQITAANQKGILKVIDEYEIMKKRLQLKEKVLHYAEQNEHADSLAKVLDIFDQYMHEQVTQISMITNNRAVIIEGRVDDKLVIENLINQLKKISDFKEVSVESIANIKTEQKERPLFQFTLNCKLE